MNKKNPLFYLFGIVLFLTSCNTNRESINPLKHVLNTNNPYIKKVMDSVADYEVQIRYTQINRIKDSISFKDFDFQVNANNYFYPASTIKFPVAALALDKLNDIDTLNRNSKFYIEGDSIETTFAKEIVKIFAVSDNTANNRLFEFLGEDAINDRLQKIGILNSRISHQLGIEEHDITTKPLIIYLNDSTISSSESIINTSPTPLDLKGIKKGVGYYDDDEYIDEPFDFSLKNYFPLHDQHELLKRIIFPEKYSKSQKLNLNENQLNFLRNSMSILPKNAGYSVSEYPDGYCKFFMFGDSKETIPEHIKIYNKVGFAYGTLTDCAYIQDTKNNIDFMLTATILVNKNKIFNDDTYENNSIGLPFLAALGREIYNYELDRKK